MNISDSSVTLIRLLATVGLTFPSILPASGAGSVPGQITVFTVRRGEISMNEKTPDAGKVAPHNAISVNGFLVISPDPIKESPPRPPRAGDKVPPAAVKGVTPAPAEAGPRIMAEAFGRLTGALTESLAKHGPAKSLEVCSMEAPRIAAEVSKKHGVTVRRATEKPRNPRNQADEAERAVLSGFAEELAKGTAPQPRAVTRPDGQVDFFAPILIASPVCLQCHGRSGQEITPETTAAIRQRYPEDKATGYRSGELRGLWKITFPAAP